ncbi:MAG: flagellar basal-body MS-ring/collar protein FliF [Deltaproteobacteria bacterium]|nr:flagellar basal-body MS-ring/collar protein FliF [Deltaproteobacteria bacterium]MCW8894167.1 flagellar basal-body MS-ring/collar protein FliF [Deltaproteobacteria bacterium]MCW9049657.1 flagellar basal-body MS-ring/collar protein FliF [Deltaproteobacteria bacterium]
MAEEEKAEMIAKKNMLDVITEWSLARKLSLVGAAAISAVIFTLIIMQSQVADYSLLFANLPSRDASSVVEWLKDRKIPYRLEDGGRDIMIPADKVYEARIELAGSGLAEGGVGFEIFDKQSFGMTDFAQKVNYRRALQGELMRTITSLAPVEAARIHLALPEKRLFREQQQAATASVIVKLSSGRSLKESQLQGIVHLVAGSVEGLESENVTVVDSSGKILSKSRSDELAGPMTPGMLNYQQAMERSLETRAQSLLDRALGAGNSMARVNAEVDFDQRERVEESLDPKGAVVVSEQTSSEEGASESTSGVPGVVSNLQGATGTTATTPASRSEETVNYELSKVVSKTVQSVGTLKSLSVSVLVADRVTPGVDGAEPTSTPRSAKEIQEIEQMIRSALGINDTRGDLISVVSMPFETGFSDEPMPQPSIIDKVYPFMPLIKYSLLAIASLLAYLLLLKPLLRTLRSAQAETQPMKTVEELEAELRGESSTPLLGGPSDPLARIRQEVLGGDMLPVQVVKNWLREEPAES